MATSSKRALARSVGACCTILERPPVAGASCFCSLQRSFETSQHGPGLPSLKGLDCLYRLKMLGIDGQRQASIVEIHIFSFL